MFAILQKPSKQTKTPIFVTNGSLRIGARALNFLSGYGSDDWAIGGLEQMIKNSMEFQQTQENHRST